MSEGELARVFITGSTVGLASREASQQDRRQMLSLHPQVAAAQLAQAPQDRVGEARATRTEERVGADHHIGELSVQRLA